jgi:hypothetical protein
VQCSIAVETREQASTEVARTSESTAKRGQVNSSLKGSIGMRVNRALDMLAIKHEKRKSRQQEVNETARFSIKNISLFNF